MSQDDHEVGRIESELTLWFDRFSVVDWKELSANFFMEDVQIIKCTVLRKLESY